jgi:(E)-4-hydroxy-3-methylbut-2-enyl-diphosphate synthase
MLPIPRAYGIAFTSTWHYAAAALYDSMTVCRCIVNGPGEMADANFGYVGGAPGKIDLYVGKEVVRRGIPMATATDELIELIKQHDMWVDKEEQEEEQKEPQLA